MRREHDRFESLAGAVMLGEVTAAERAEFGFHADACAECRAAVTSGDRVRVRLDEVRAAETWYPTVDVMARVRERDARRTHLALGVLAYGLAFSVVLEVAVASGVAGRFASAARATVPWTTESRAGAASFASESSPKALPTGTARERSK